MPRIVLAALLVVLAGCSGTDQSDEVTDARPVQVAMVPASEANLIFFVTNVVDRNDRIRIDVNGVRAVDATFPTAAARAHPPIFSYRFSVPATRITVRVRTPRETKVLRFASGAGKRWVVVQNQNADPEQIPMSLTVHTERPLFG